MEAKSWLEIWSASLVVGVLECVVVEEKEEEGR